jgi:hypothetical protein
VVLQKKKKMRRRKKKKNKKKKKKKKKKKTKKIEILPCERHVQSLHMPVTNKSSLFCNATYS